MSATGGPINATRRGSHVGNKLLPPQPENKRRSSQAKTSIPKSRSLPNLNRRKSSVHPIDHKKNPNLSPTVKEGFRKKFFYSRKVLIRLHHFTAFLMIASISLTFVHFKIPIGFMGKASSLGYVLLLCIPIVIFCVHSIYLLFLLFYHREQQFQSIGYIYQGNIFLFLVYIVALGLACWFFGTLNYEYVVDEMTRGLTESSSVWVETQTYYHCCGIDDWNFWIKPENKNFSSHVKDCCRFKDDINKERCRGDITDLDRLSCEVWENGCYLEILKAACGLYISYILIFLAMLILNTIGFISMKETTKYPGNAMRKLVSRRIFCKSDKDVAIEVQANPKTEVLTFVRHSSEEILTL